MPILLIDLAPGSSGVWVVKDNLFVGCVVVVRRILPIIYMIPASSLLENISQELSEPRVSLPQANDMDDWRQPSFEGMSLVDNPRKPAEVHFSGLSVDIDPSNNSPEQNADLQRLDKPLQSARFSKSQTDLGINSVPVAWSLPCSASPTLTGPSTTGPSTTGPSTTGPSTTGPSITSNTEPRGVIDDWRGGKGDDKPWYPLPTDSSKLPPPGPGINRPMYEADDVKAATKASSAAKTAAELPVAPPPGTDHRFQVRAPFFCAHSHFFVFWLIMSLHR
jgi:hypothetical protein